MCPSLLSNDVQSHTPKHIAEIYEKVLHSYQLCFLWKQKLNNRSLILYRSNNFFIFESQNRHSNYSWIWESTIIAYPSTIFQFGVNTNFSLQKLNLDSESFYSVAQQPKSDIDRLIFEVFRSHAIRHTQTHTAGFLWTSVQSPQTPLTSQNKTYTIEEHPCPHQDMQNSQYLLKEIVKSTPKLN
jgi:hypothetical protein